MTRTLARGDGCGVAFTAATLGGGTVTPMRYARQTGEASPGIASHPSRASHSGPSRIRASHRGSTSHRARAAHRALARIAPRPAFNPSSRRSKLLNRGWRSLIRARQGRRDPAARRIDAAAVADAARAHGPVRHRVAHAVGAHGARPHGGRRARTGSGWRRVSYAAALDAARRIGQALLARRLGPARPLVILSDNSVDHALLMLGALHVGVPVVPVSPAYSLMSADFAKLRHIIGLVRPGLVWTDDSATLRRRACRHRRHGHADRRAGGVAAGGRRGGGACTGVARHRREDPVHLGFHRRSQGRREHPRHAHRQPADAGAGLAVHRAAPAGGGRLAAVEPHLRRQPQLQSRAPQRRHALRRRRQAGAWR